MIIALVQQHASHDAEDNLTRGAGALKEAALNGAELVAYPELAFLRFLPQTPADPDALQRAEPVPGPTTERFRALAASHGVVVVLNLFERDGGRTFDTSPVIDADGRLVGKVRMVHIMEAERFHERGYYAPGDLGAGVFDTAAGRIGVAICYDRHYPEYMRALALKGAELVVVPQAGARNEWPPGIFESELGVASFQNGYFGALVNRTGREERIEFAGGSFVTDPDGQVVARAPEGEDAILYHDVDLKRVSTCVARRHFLPDRRPELYPGPWLS